MTIDTWEFFGAFILMGYGFYKLLIEVARLRDDLDDHNRELDKKLEEMRFQLEQKIDEVENTVIDPQWRKGEWDPILGCRPADYVPFGDKDE
tara:strand:- start:653 stop:928 length:276 start_codon:yes stop_codon:yes gene_type:complete